MTHQFDIEIAERVGVNAAIIYSNIEFWCAKNKANNKNFFDGSYWTYNSVKAWTELFPYFSIKIVRTALEKLEKEELIQSGNYNKAGYDRTKWYSIKVTLGEMDLPSEANGVVHKGKPIPDNKPDNKLNTKRLPSEKPRDFQYPIEFEDVWGTYRVGDKWSAYKVFAKRLKDYSSEEILKALSSENKKEFGKRHFSTVLNGDLDQLIETNKSSFDNKELSRLRKDFLKKNDYMGLVEYKGMKLNISPDKIQYGEGFLKVLPEDKQLTVLNDLLGVQS